MDFLFEVNVGGYSSEIGIIPNEKEVSKDDASKSLISCDPESVKPIVQNLSDFGKVSMIKNQYQLQYNVNTAGGASGSSVINIKTGMVFAINTYRNVEGSQSWNFCILYKRSDK